MIAQLLLTRKADQHVLVSKDGVEVNDDLLLVLGELPPLDVRTEIVGPAESAAFAAPVQPGILRQVSPAPVAMPLDVLHQLLVLLRRPRPLLHDHLIAARRPPHVSPARPNQGTEKMEDKPEQER
ncbi:hypothetical protein MUK42_03038 [Musa troglodytarum]|uniref:Uncharacterized protein n=1 Tax=Musa troglodytarum TaxID=320322 RepID=A0A9E7G458_9LILI|nr:hypothetical protein MUK42_03038 [Musa troglodytarum]